MPTGLRDLLEHAVEARCLFSTTKLLGDLAHEINQPLAAIAAYARGSVNQLRFNTAAPADLLEVSEQIAIEAMRAGNTVRRLRERVRAAGGRKECVDMGALVADVLRSLPQEVLRLEVQVRFDNRTPTPTVVGYAQGLARAVSTLVSRCIETAANYANYERVLRLKVAPSTDADAVEIGIEIGGYDPSAPTGGIIPQSVPSCTACLAAEVSLVRSLVESHGGSLWVVAEPRGLCSARLTLPGDRV